MAQLRIVGLKNLPIPDIEAIRTIARKLESAYRLHDIDAIDSMLDYLFKKSEAML